MPRCPKPSPQSGERLHATSSNSRARPFSPDFFSPALTTEVAIAAVPFERSMIGWVIPLRLISCDVPMVLHVGRHFRTGFPDEGAKASSLRGCVCPIILPKPIHFKISLTIARVFTGLQLEATLINICFVKSYIKSASPHSFHPSSSPPPRFLLLDGHLFTVHREKPARCVSQPKSPNITHR